MRCWVFASPFQKCGRSLTPARTPWILRTSRVGLATNPTGPLNLTLSVLGTSISNFTSINNLARETGASRQTHVDFWPGLHQGGDCRNISPLWKQSPRNIGRRTHFPTTVMTKHPFSDALADGVRARGKMANLFLATWCPGYGGR